MPVTRLATAGLLTAAGALVIGADQRRSLADQLQSAGRRDSDRERIDADHGTNHAEAASRSDNDGHPLGPVGVERS